MSYFIVDSKDNNSLSHTERGIIYRKDLEQNKLVCKTFPYTQEFSTEQKDEINQYLDNGEWKFYPSYEGTIIRIVNDVDNGNRFIATHKKINAFDSRWGSSKSFGELFQESIQEHYMNTNNIELYDIFETFINSLSKDKHHTFLLCSNLDTRMVCSRDGEVFYVGSFDASTNEFVGFTEDVSKFCGVIKELDTVKNTDNVIDYVDDINPLLCQGIIAVRQDKFEAFKVMNGYYTSLARLRNNNPNLMMRYLELYLTKSDLLEEFTIFFSNMNDSFKYIENTFIKLVFLLQNIYKKRYIQRAYVHTTPVLHNFLKSLVERGLEKDEAKLNGIIKEELGKLNVGVVYSMILNYFDIVE
jgi:hypothetical protein